MAADRADRGRDFRRGRAGCAGGGMRRLAGQSRRAARLDHNTEQPIVCRFRRLNKLGRVNQLPLADFSDALLLPLHARQRDSELPRPRQQRTAPQAASPARPEEQPRPVRCGQQRLPPPAPERWQRVDPGGGTAGVEGDAKFRPMYAPPRGAPVARPHRPTRRFQAADLPDPTRGPNSPIDPTSPQIRTKLGACNSLLRTANPNRL